VTAAPRLVHGFVAPRLDGAETGGTLYNAALIAALRRAGVACRHVDLESAPFDLSVVADVIWVDSLYLHAMPELRARSTRMPLHLVLHYLPSLVRLGRVFAPHEATGAELQALALADAVLVTSRFMQQTVAELGYAKPVLCVEPGVDTDVAPSPAPIAWSGDGARALMLCNLTEGKGVLPLLTALAEHATDSDALDLAIAGSITAEPEYAERCRALIAGHPWLRGRVRMTGPLRHEQALSLLRESDALVSASRMESYGMALAEARALGVPILARAGGHTAAHVDERAGGELAPDEFAVARRLLAWTREHGGLRERRRLAAAQARTRGWDDAAAEWIGGVRQLG
jgi:glycosyltransferase involved in cell wall biosynthesis